MKSSTFVTEIKDLSVEDLRERARALSEELMKLRFRRVSSQIEKPHQFKELRRNLARVLGLISTKRTA